MSLTRVYRVDRDPIDEVVERCCDILRGGGTVVFPTETVYGVGARVDSVRAIEALLHAKNRGLEPLTIHISSLRQLDALGIDLGPEGERLARRFWPGPLTIVVPLTNGMLRHASGLTPFIGVRMPAHPIALKLIDCAGPLVAPSANVSGRPSPVRGWDAIIEMFGRVDAIIDAGDCVEGLESTVVQLSPGTPRILRLGPIDPRDLEQTLGRPISMSSLPVQRRRYKPHLRVVLSYVGALNAVDMLRGRAPEPMCIAVLSEDLERGLELPKNVIALKLGSLAEPLTIARNLFKLLRKAEGLGCATLIVPSLPEQGILAAVMSRLRASADEILH